MNTNKEEIDQNKLFDEIYWALLTKAEDEGKKAFEDAPLCKESILVTNENGVSVLEALTEEALTEEKSMKALTYYFWTYFIKPYQDDETQTQKSYENELRQYFLKMMPKIKSCDLLNFIFELHESLRNEGRISLTRFTFIKLFLMPSITQQNHFYKDLRFVFVHAGEKLLNERFFLYKIYGVLEAYYPTEIKKFETAEKFRRFGDVSKATLKTSIALFLYENSKITDKLADKEKGLINYFPKNLIKIDNSLEAAHVWHIKELRTFLVLAASLSDLPYEIIFRIAFFLMPSLPEERKLALCEALTEDYHESVVKDLQRSLISSLKSYCEHKFWEKRPCFFNEATALIAKCQKPIASINDFLPLLEKAKSDVLNLKQDRYLEIIEKFIRQANAETRGHEPIGIRNR